MTDVIGEDVYHYGELQADGSVLDREHLPSAAAVVTMHRMRIVISTLALPFQVLPISGKRISLQNSSPLDKGEYRSLYKAIWDSTGMNRAPNPIYAPYALVYFIEEERASELNLSFYAVDIQRRYEALKKGVYRTWDAWGLAPALHMLNLNWVPKNESDVAMDMALEIRGLVRTLLGIRGATHDHLPLPVPSSLMASDLPTLRQRRGHYGIAAKTDGMRSLLVYGRIADGTQQFVALCDRGARVTLLSIGPSKAVEADPFLGTVVDGEILDRTFYAFDLPIAHGYDYTAEGYRSRLSRLAAVASQFKFESDWVIQGLAVKEFVSCAIGGDNLREMARGPTADGLILADMEASYKLGRQFTTYKWKAPEKCTVDLKWNKDTLQSEDGAIKCVPKKSDQFEMVEGHVYECTLAKTSEGPPEARVLSCRVDKSRGNSTFVIQQTMKNIEENLSLTALFP
jgi:hypothetical protein